jgi:hypothetical protein
MFSVLHVSQRAPRWSELPIVPGAIAGGIGLLHGVPDVVSVRFAGHEVNSLTSNMIGRRQVYTVKRGARELLWFSPCLYDVSNTRDKYEEVVISVVRCIVGSRSRGLCALHFSQM